MGSWIKNKFFILKNRKFYKNNISFNIKINIVDNLLLGKNVTILDGAILQIDKTSKITIGDNTRIGYSTQLMTYGGNIKIGSECVINQNCILYGHGGLEIGNNVIIAAHTIIIPANHNYGNIEKPIMYQGESRKGIKIESNVWIGANCVILDGVTIGSGSVIGAGSVVAKSIAKNSIAVGNPANVIKSRI